MTKQEFIQKIDVATVDVGNNNMYICNAIAFVFSCDSTILEDFISHFKPADCRSFFPWYGEPVRVNVPKRLEVIKEFKQLAIERELYKEY